MTDFPLIFTHYGYSNYLKLTLSSARKYNPEMPMVLIGDKFNSQLAIDHGWSHVLYDDIFSQKRDEFNKFYRRVEGAEHYGVRNGRDWVKFVMERFFCINSYLVQNGYEKYWHFDSDTMIVANLDRYSNSEKIKELDCSTLCWNKCPSGLVRTDFISGFCDYMIGIFKDTEYLNKVQREINPKHAFTEMWAFVNYKNSSSNLKTHRLSQLFLDENISFDDCICTADGFDFVYSESLKKKIKNYYSDGGSIYCNNDVGLPIKFCTVNCSWVDDRVFDWVFQCDVNKNNRLVDFLDQS